jgi:DNA (cytosine-5)-methyltransferase 1
VSAPLRAFDLFCGGGGSSWGAHEAGLEVVGCLNHWDVAVETHRAAFPGVMHWCEDAAVANPLKVPEHDILLASPSCVGHANCRGKEKPHHDAARATADCVLRFLEAKRPPIAVIENVPEFLKWVRFPAWKLGVELLGYTVTIQILDAADAGVAQNRKRVIIVCILGEQGVTIPTPTMPHVSALSMLDIEGGNWKRWSKYVVKTRARIERAQATHGPDVLVPYYGSARGGRSWHRPIGTLTTKDRYIMVRGAFSRVLTLKEMLRLSSFPEDYPLQGNRGDGVTLIGNAVPPKLMQYVLTEVVSAVARLN